MKQIRWRKPKTEVGHVFLTMMLWYDIWKKGYRDKGDSKYYDYVCDMYNCCPLCEFDYSCNDCPLPRCGLMESPFDKWSRENIQGARRIFILCKNKVNRLIKPDKITIEDVERLYKRNP